MLSCFSLPLRRRRGTLRILPAARSLNILSSWATACAILMSFLVCGSLTINAMVKKSSQRSIAHGQYPGKAFKIWLFGRLNVRLDDPSGWIHNKQNALAWRSRNQKNRNISRKGAKAAQERKFRLVPLAHHFVA